MSKKMSNSMKKKFKLQFLFAVCFLLLVTLIGVVSVSHKNKNVHEISVKILPPLPSPPYSLDSIGSLDPVNAAMVAADIMKDSIPEKLLEEVSQQIPEDVSVQPSLKTTHKTTSFATTTEQVKPSNLFTRLTVNIPNTTKPPTKTPYIIHDYDDPTPKPKNKTDEEKLPVYLFAGQQYVHEDTHKELLKNNSQYAKDIQVLIDNDYIVYMPNKTLEYPEPPLSIPLYEGDDGKIYVNETVVHTEFNRPYGKLNEAAKYRIDQVVKGIVRYLPRDKIVNHIRHPQPYIITGPTFNGIEHTKLANKYNWH